jgi:hypothetical protein
VVGRRTTYAINECLREVKGQGQNFWGYGVNKGEMEKRKVGIHRKCNIRGHKPGVIEAGVAGQEMR